MKMAPNNVFSNKLNLLFISVLPTTQLFFLFAQIESNVHCYMCDHGDTRTTWSGEWMLSYERSVVNNR